MDRPDGDLNALRRVFPRHERAPEPHWFWPRWPPHVWQASLPQRMPPELVAIVDAYVGPPAIDLKDHEAGLAWFMGQWRGLRIDSTPLRTIQEENCDERFIRTGLGLFDLCLIFVDSNGNVKGGSEAPDWVTRAAFYDFPDRITRIEWFDYDWPGESEQLSPRSSWDRMDRIGSDPWHTQMCGLMDVTQLGRSVPFELWIDSDGAWLMFADNSVDLWRAVMARLDSQHKHQLAARIDTFRRQGATIRTALARHS